MIDYKSENYEDEMEAAVTRIHWILIKVVLHVEGTQ